MITKDSVSIAASAERVWSVFTDIERWPTWTASVTSVEALGGRGIEVGRRFRIKQPRLPGLVWQVTDVDPGRGWTWVTRSVGATTSASHEVLPDGDSAVVSQTIDQRGPLGVVVAVAMRRMTRRYLALEGQGLKAATEQRGQVAAQP